MLLRNKFFIIFTLLMLVGGVGYNIYYFKVGKQKKVMKSLGREQTKTPKKAKGSPNPTQSAGFSSPVITTNQGTTTPPATASDSDRISLPLSERLLKLTQGKTSPAGEADLAANKSSWVDPPRSNRNPFISLEEERMSKGPKSTRTQPQYSSQVDNPSVEQRKKPGRLVETQPLLQETPDIPSEVVENEPKPQPIRVQPTLTQPIVVAAETELADLKVSAIIINGDRKIAIIEGQKVGEGSFIGSERVVEIKSDRVTLQRGRNKRDLFLSRSGPSVPLIVKKANR